jgi:hypothetical protein
VKEEAVLHYDDSWRPPLSESAEPGYRAKCSCCALPLLGRLEQEHKLCAACAFAALDRQTVITESDSDEMETPRGLARLGPKDVPGSFWLDAPWLGGTD